MHITIAVRVGEVVRTDVEDGVVQYVQNVDARQTACRVARAGMLGCVENVEINVPSIKDQKVAAQLTERARALRELAVALDASLSSDR